MTQIRPTRTPGTPPTLEEWHAWAEHATRSLTDSPIGRHTAARRQTDKTNSEHVTPQPLNPRPVRRGSPPPPPRTRTKPKEATA